MSFPGKARGILLAFAMALTLVPLWAQAQGKASTVRIVGLVRDETNAIALPGVPVEVVGTKEVVYTDVDGRYVLQVPPGKHQLKIALEGYQERTINVEATDRTLTADVGLTMARFAETVTVTAQAIDVQTSSAEAQLIERKQSSVISDNVGAQEMKSNGDSDAAAAMTRVTGLSLVDNQFIFVRGLGERYSNTTLSGSVLPTTEPDKKVVPLDLFPTGLIDSVQVSKSYSPDKSAEFAGGLVQIVPMKLPNRPVVDFSYGLGFYSTATGKTLGFSPLGNRDVWGYDDGARALPSGIPDTKIVRQGIYTPDVGFGASDITTFGKLFENRWQPVNENAKPGQNWSATFGNRFKNLGVVASVTHSYKEQFLDEERRFYRIGDDGALDATTDYDIQTGSQKAQLGVVGNLSYQFNTNQRISIENFYTHSGRDEGRFFEGRNVDNSRDLHNFRLQFIEEGLLSNAVGGEHFFQNLSNSRFDWRVNIARAYRDEPDLRETLYERPLDSAANVVYTYADESQSGFRMFNELDDDTKDFTANWATLSAGGGRPTQYKFGVSYVDRGRDFQSRRFHFIPITTQKADTGNLLFNNRLSPEEIFVPSNIGTAFRLNEETRPTDAYRGDQTTASGYGMVDVSITGRTRLIAGARVERFDQTVTTQDPFGLFAREVQAQNKNTDVFPAVNFVLGATTNSNLRLSYSTTVNRPEFRELAEFEFTDVVGNRAVKGNADLQRALIQNVDGRWERFSGGRGVIAASVFYKYFDKPIERVVIAAANPIATFQNSDNARNFGVELEAAHQLGENFFLNANYTFVDSRITLLPEQLGVQTSSERPLAGQSKNLFNVGGEFSMRGFSTRVLYNYFGDRISDVGANGAPDIIEQGRGSLDLVFAQRIRSFGVRLSFDNLTDSDYLFTQTLTSDEPQRLYKLGRTVSLSFSFNVY
ncbi:MAG TPA: TonB-dependent receptor [Vicinamibacterales bacterium]|nr:TonB-dependent receptor [Vicinamibacterales bacterium]